MGSTLETWTGIEGTSIGIADLKLRTADLIKVPNTSTRLQNVLEGPNNIGDNNGSRMKGWLLPPVTGDYWVLLCIRYDTGELWLSTDSNPTVTVLACHQPYAGTTRPRDWKKYPEQKSREFYLVTDRAYYYKVRD